MQTKGFYLENSPLSLQLEKTLQPNMVNNRPADRVRLRPDKLVDYDFEEAIASSSGEETESEAKSAS